MPTAGFFQRDPPEQLAFEFDHLKVQAYVIVQKAELDHVLVQGVPTDRRVLKIRLLLQMFDKNRKTRMQQIVLIEGGLHGGKIFHRVLRLRGYSGLILRKPQR